MNTCDGINFFLPPACVLRERGVEAIFATNGRKALCRPDIHRRLDTFMEISCKLSDFFAFYAKQPPQTCSQWRNVVSGRGSGRERGGEGRKG